MDESEEEFKECEIKAEPSASQKPLNRSKNPDPKIALQPPMAPER